MAVPAIHPGEHIAEELRVLDMSVAAFAGRLKVPATTSLQFSTGTSGSPEMWR